MTKGVKSEKRKRVVYGKKVHVISIERVLRQAEQMTVEKTEGGAEET